MWALPVCRRYTWAIQHRCSAGTNSVVESCIWRFSTADLLHSAFPDSALFNLL